MTTFARQLYGLLAKDLLLELRTKESLTATLVFALLVLVTFNFALDLRPEVMAAVGPGILWVAVVFAGVIALGRSFAAERDQGTLETLLAAPIDRSALFLAKALGVGLVMGVAEIVVVPLFAALFDVALSPAVLPVLLLGTVGLAAVGTLLSAIASHTRAREVLLPVLLFPIIVPLLIAVVEATGLALGSGLAQDRPWVSLLVAFDVVYLSLGALVFEHVLEE